MSTEQKKVGSDVIAELFGLTTRRINQLTNEGVLSAEKVKGNNLYDRDATVRQYVKHLTDKLAGRGDREANEKETARRLNEAEAKLKEAKAKMAEIKLAELRGQMHRSEDVEAIISDFIMTVRSAFTSLSGRLSVDVAKANTAAEANKIIRAETNRILEDLSGYQYDPAAFAERVKKREGAIDNSAETAEDKNNSGAEEE